MSRETLKTVTISLTSSFCTALFLVACTAAANKQTSTDDGSGGGPNGGGFDGANDDADEDESIAEALEQIAALSTAVAAQQASIEALEIEVATLYENTYRWVTYEAACTLGEGTDVTVDYEPGGIFKVRHDMGENGFWEGGFPVTALDETESSFGISCRSTADHVAKARRIVAYAW